MALQVGELFASFNVDTSGAMTSVGNLMTQVGDLQAAYISLGSIMTNVLTRNIVNGAKDALSATMRFDQAMANVAKVSGLDTQSEEFEILRNYALDYASTTKYTANEVADAMYYMGLAGWKSQQMMAGLPGMLAMGAASGENLSRVSDILTDGLTAMGYSAADSAVFANVLAAAAGNSNTSITQIGEAMKYAGTIAGTFDFTIEDVALTLGILANNGIKGSQAGVALRRILTNLAAPTKTVSEAMYDLGLSLNDGSGNAIGLYDYIVNLRAAFNDFKSLPIYDDLQKWTTVDPENTDAIKLFLDDARDAGKAMGIFLQNTPASAYDELQQYAEAIFEIEAATGGIAQLPAAALAKALAGQYGLTALLALINVTDQDLLGLKESIDTSNEGNGTAFEMAQTQLDNLQGKITILQSAWERLQITFSDDFTGTLSGITERVTEAINGFAELPDPVRKTVEEMLAVAAATGPLLMGVGLLSKYSQLLAPLVTGAFTPTGLLVSTGMLFGIAAFDDDNSVGEMLESMSDFAAEKLDAFAEYLAENTPEISGRMGALIESLTNVVASLAPSLSGVLLTGLESLVGALSQNAEGLVGIGTTLFTTLLGSITENIPTLLPLLFDAVISVFSALAENLPQIAESLGSAVGTLVGTLAGMVLDPGNWAQIFNLGVAIVQGIGAGLLSGAKGVFSGFVSSLTGFIRDTFGMSDEEIEEAYGEWADAAKDNLLAPDFVEAAIASMPQESSELQAMLDAYDYVMQEVPELAYKFQDYSFLFNDSIRGLLDTLANSEDVDKASAALYALQALGYGDLVSSMLEEGQFDMDEYTDLSDYSLDQLLGILGLDPASLKAAEASISDAEGTLGEVYTLTEQEQDMLSSLESVATELGLADTNGGKGLKNGIDSGKNAVVEAAQSLGMEAVTNALMSMSYADGYAAGSAFGQGIAAGLSSAVAAVAAAAASIAAAAASSLSVNVGGADNSTGGPVMRQTSMLADGINALAKRPVVLTQDGKTIANISAGYQSSAFNRRTQTIALGYGK